MPSISARISAGFYALAFLMLVLSAFTFSDLRFLASHIREGAAVSTFVEHVMDMRRQEKNYFLYRDGVDLTAAVQQLDEALALLAENPELFQELCEARPCARLREELGDYGALLADLAFVPGEALQDSEDAVRRAGHRLTELARGLAENERTALSEAVSQSGRWLLAAVLGVGLLGGLLGPAVARSVVRPLRQLEVDLATIAEGRFKELPPPSRDRELVSFAAAFNRMLGELENRRRQLLHSQKLASLGVLVSGVAHELNNPLSNISTSCQLALEELDGGDPAQVRDQVRDQIRDWLRQIDEQTERARRIVLALSDYARRRPLTLEPVEVNALIDTTLLLVRRELGRQVTVVREVPAGLAILADRQRLQQVFINLLKNAVDAGGPEVTITLAARPLETAAPALPRGRYRLGDLPPVRSPDHPRYALVTVSDNGPGVGAEVLGHIFDPFFTTREVGQGMGLGLYIVQEIVQDLGGSIAVDSEPGRGTRFEIALPCAAGERGT